MLTVCVSNTRVQEDSMSEVMISKGQRVIVICW